MIRVLYKLVLSIVMVTFAQACSPVGQSTIEPRSSDNFGAINSDNFNQFVQQPVLPSGFGQTLTQDTATGYVVDQIKYRLTVGGLKICTADIIVGIRDNFQLDFPTPVFDCKLGINLDISTMLGGLSANNTGNSAGPAGPLAALTKNITTVNNHMAFKSFGGFTFSPAAPIFFSPLSVREEFLENLKFVSRVTVTAGGQPYYGFIKSELERDNRGNLYTTYKSKLSGRTYEDVLTWSRESEGYPDALKTKALLFDRMEVKWSMSPVISIPRIQIVGTVENLAGSNLDLPFGDGPLGNIIKGAKVTVTLEAME